MLHKKDKHWIVLYDVEAEVLKGSELMYTIYFEVHYTYKTGEGMDREEWIDIP